MKSRGSRSYEDFRDSLRLSMKLTAMVRPMLEDCKRDWERHVSNNFATEGGEVGGWKPLDEKTRITREALGYGPRPILDMRGILKKSWSISFDTIGDNQTIKLEFAHEKNWLGGDLAKQHHYGGKGFNPLTRKSFGTPRRRLFDESVLSNIFKNRVVHPFNRAFANLLKEMGGR